MQPIGGTAWTGVGGRGEQHSLLCGRRTYSGMKPHLSADHADWGVPNDKDSGTTDEYDKYKGGCFYPGVHMGASGRSSVEA